MKNLLVVESPAKAKTINKYLGKDYKVLASMGHIRSLIPKDGSVDVANNFEMKFENLTKSSKAVKEIVDTAKEVDNILLAPDPDREGEAIAWHILEVLKQKKVIKKQKVQRITYNEITKKAVEEALNNPRNIDDNLVDAQQARQALDYLVGFNLSPVLWRKLPGSKSAGRVQSVALRLICDRENEIEAFKRQEYWSVDVDLNTEKINTYLEDVSIDGYSVRFNSNNRIKHFVRGNKYKEMSLETLIARKTIIQNLKDILLKTKIYKIIDNKSDKHKGVNKWVYLIMENIGINNICYDLVFDAMITNDNNTIYLYDFKVITKKTPAILYEYRLNGADAMLSITQKNFNVKKNKITKQIINDIIRLNIKQVQTNSKNFFTASLTHINNTKLDKFFINNEKLAKEIENILKNKKYEVLDIEKKQTKRNPYAPFTTSTLQQEASKKLGFSAKQTMQVAQKLYEAGHITYMRTDGVYTAPEAIKSTRDLIKSKYGDKYLPSKPILYQSKAKNIQEAHEAIRPTHPENIGVGTDNNEKRLYDLVWKRLVASQMESVLLDQVGVNVITDGINKNNGYFDNLKIEKYKINFKSNNNIKHFVCGNKYDDMTKELLIARKLVIENLREILTQAKIEKIIINKSDKRKDVKKWVYLETKGAKLNGQNYNVVFDAMILDNSNTLYLYDFKILTKKNTSAILCEHRLNAADAVISITDKNLKVKKNKITNNISKNLIRILNNKSVNNNDIYKLRAVGTTIKFEGFYVLYNINRENDDEKRLPNLVEGQKLGFNNVKTEQHFTEPPARYSEASLVKKMEELGIGRPSTYATILSVIQEREYVRLEQKRFFPEERGRIVTAFLKEYFKRYVEYNYTAELENNLDSIAEGKEKRIDFLNSFWKPFKKEVDNTMEIRPSDVVKNLSPQLLNHILGFDENGKLKDVCPKCGGKLTLKFGKFGAFISCGNYPDCKHIQNVGIQITDENNTEKFEPKQLGEFKGKNVYLKKGPYGFYIQLGENSIKKTTKTKSKSKSKKDENPDKPKLLGIPKTEQEPQNFTMEKALLLLNLPDLPRNLGKYEDKDVLANKGRFGPYLSYNGNFYSVKNDDIYTIELDRATEIIKEKDSKPKTIRTIKKTKK